MDGELDPLPHGLEAVFTAFWRHLTTRPTWPTLREVLAVLTVAREPLPLDVLAQLMGVALITMDPLLEPLTPLSRLREDDTVCLRHGAIQALLTERDGHDGFTLSAGHGRFVRLLRPFATSHGRLSAD